MMRGAPHEQGASGTAHTTGTKEETSLAFLPGCGLFLCLGMLRQIQSPPSTYLLTKCYTPATEPSFSAVCSPGTEATNLVRRNTEVVARLVEGTSTHHYNVLSDLFDAQIMRIQKLRDACSFEALYGLKKAQPLYDDQVNIYYARYKQARKRAEAIWPSHAER